MAFRGYQGWDRGKRRYLSIGMVNSGEVGATELNWIDAKTLAVGQGFRTNAAGLAQLSKILRPLAVETLPVEVGQDDSRRLVGLLLRSDVMRRYRKEMLEPL